MDMDTDTDTHVLNTTLVVWLMLTSDAIHSDVHTLSRGQDQVRRNGCVKP